MSIPTAFNYNPGFPPNINLFNCAPAPRQSLATQPGGQSQTQALAQVVQVLQELIQSLSQLTQNWGGLVGSPAQTAPGSPPLPRPSDANDAASYLKAQRAGGALNGKTAVNQSDGIPGTRFATVQQPQLWQANVARQYAYQFAAYASGNDPLSPQGLQAGAQATQSMSPDAQLFMQVASVFKGNLLNGPGNYDNPGLKKLLQKVGATDLAQKPGVGETDVQTVGAITAAMNRGQLSLQDVINSGTIDNLDRYRKVISYVQGGQFANDLRSYDTV